MLKKVLKPRIIIVDDDAVTRRTLIESLGKYCDEISEAASAEEMFDLLHHKKPHVILLDYMLPGLNGIEATTTLRKQSEVGIIMISTNHDRDTRLSALQDGADDFISKPLDHRELLLKIVRVSSRISGIYAEDPELEEFEIGSARVSGKDRKLHLQNSQFPVDLTAAELTCLKYLKARIDQTCRREQLHRAISGYASSDTTERTVDTIIARLRKKVSTNAPEIEIKSVRGVGYSLSVKD